MGKSTSKGTPQKPSQTKAPNVNAMGYVKKIDVAKSHPKGTK